MAMRPKKMAYFSAILVDIMVVDEVQQPLTDQYLTAIALMMSYELFVEWGLYGHKDPNFWVEKTPEGEGINNIEKGN